YLRWILHGLELRLRIPPIERPEGVNLRPVVDTGQHLSLEGARRPHAPFAIIAGTLSRNEPGVEGKLGDQRQQKPGTVIPPRTRAGSEFIPVSDNLNEIQSVF